MYITNGTFTKDVKDARSSIGEYLRSSFPNIKPLQIEYKANAGDLLVDSFGASAGTIGTATDLIVRLILDPEDVPSSALMLFPFSVVYRDVVTELAGIAGCSKRLEHRTRAAWALALCVEAYRAGAVFAPLVPEFVRGGGFTVDRMLSEATDEAVIELTSMRGLVEQRLVDTLERPLHLGPLFDLSAPGPNQRVAAEADLIANGLLLDVKTNLAPKTKAGLRPDVLKPEHVYQLLGYVLLDYSDAYNIDRVGIFSARYGTLTDWSLEYVTSITSGGAFDLSIGRQHVWNLLHEEIQFK